MNVEISTELLEKSMKIEIGIHTLQSKISKIIDRYQYSKIDHRIIVAKYREELEQIQNELKNFLHQQKSFEKMLMETKKEVTDMNDEFQRLLTANKLRAQ